MNPTLEAGSGYLNQTRPADISLPTWNLGRDAALDVTVVNPLNSSNIEGAIIPGLITEEAADRKHRNNDAKCRELGWECIPIAVELKIDSKNNLHSTACRKALHTKWSTKMTELWALETVNPHFGHLGSTAWEEARANLCAQSRHALNSSGAKARTFPTSRRSRASFFTDRFTALHQPGTVTTGVKR